MTLNPLPVLLSAALQKKILFTDNQFLKLIIWPLKWCTDEFLFGFAEHKLDSHFNMHLIHHLVIVTWIGKPAVNDKEFECLYTVKKDWKGEKSHPTHTVILQKKALLLVDQTQTDILWKDEGRNMEKVILRNTSKLFLKGFVTVQNTLTWSNCWDPTLSRKWEENSEFYKHPNRIK